MLRWYGNLVVDIWALEKTLVVQSIWGIILPNYMGIFINPLQGSLLTNQYNGKYEGIFRGSFDDLHLAGANLVMSISCWARFVALDEVANKRRSCRAFFTLLFLTLLLRESV